ncbi:MAG: hypothetical protein WC886_08875 [Saccharofermentanaceae bacterium]|jgi:hypothetical protein
MKTNYIIYDRTANTGLDYIAEDDSNVELIENARRFDSEKDAENFIQQKGWDDWAQVGIFQSEN